MTTTRPGHALVIGIDGVRYDSLCREETPGLDAVARDGFLRPVRVNDAGPTISGPGWTTIFTGVLASTHGIMNNTLSPNRLDEFPDVVRITRTTRPEADRFVGACWAPLVSSASGGPLFADGGFLPRSERPSEDVEGFRDDLDEQVCVAAEEFLSAHDGAGGSLAVVYLGAPDEIAHDLGVAEAYARSIRRADQRVERLRTAVAARPDAGTWTTVVVTDHGHVDAGGHGGDSPQERTAWIAAAGPEVPPLPEDAALEQADVAAQVLATLGIEPPDSPHWFGRPFGSR